MIPNYDPAAGIHYGCISQHSLMPEAMSDIWDKAHDLSYESAKDDLLNGIVRALEGDESREAQEEALESALSDLFYGERRAEEKETAISEIIEQWTEIQHSTPASEEDKDALWQFVEDRFNDSYECDQRSWLWEDEGYSLSNCLISDIFVSKSPYFTYAPECSPCVPNAGNLDSASEKMNCTACKGVECCHFTFAKEGVEESGWGVLVSCEKCGSWRTPDRIPLKTYCLGHDMFEGGTAPYPVWSVETGKRVVMVETKVDCPNCNGTGRDSTARVASVRGVSEVDVLNDALTNPDRFPEFEEFGADGRHSGKFKCCRCQGHGHSIERVQEEQE